MMPPSQPATEQAPVARERENDEPGHDLDDPDQVHGVLGRAGDEVVEMRREIARPVVGEHLGELVEPEQDGRDGECDPQQQEGLLRGGG